LLKRRYVNAFSVISIQRDADRSGHHDGSQADEHAKGHATSTTFPEWPGSAGLVRFMFTEAWADPFRTRYEA